MIISIDAEKIFDKIQHQFNTRVMVIKTKINSWDLMKLLHNKGKYKQDEKTTLRTGENTCKGNNRQRINLQNIQTAHGAQLKKKKSS